MNVSQLLRAYGLTPKKGLGQNFLVSKGILARILAAAEVEADDQILEVGPGLGLLTRSLAEKAARVVAVEVDPQLVAILQDTLADLPHVEVLSADILEVDAGEIMGSATPYKVVANLPYNITSAALRHLLESRPRPKRLVVMVQKEVARRIAASPGQMSLLAVSVQFYGAPRIIAHVPAGAFYPKPKVDSAIVRIDTFAERTLAEGDPSHFFAVVRAGFAQRRKQLRNSLAQGLGLLPALVEDVLQQCGVDPRRRAQTLSMEEWKALSQALPSRRKEEPANAGQAGENGEGASRRSGEGN